MFSKACVPFRVRISKITWSSDGAGLGDRAPFGEAKSGLLSDCVEDI